MICTLKEILKHAAKGGFAIGSFSPRHVKMVAPIIEAAMNVNSPAIVQISEREINFYSVDIKALAAEFYKQVELLRPQIPLCLHLDHAKTFGLIEEAMEHKFTSVMVDASEFDFDKNVRITNEVAAYARSFGASVESELGRIGTTDFLETEKDEEFYTVPEEAKEFCKQTGIDALAVSIGTAHGLYTTKKPKIDFERLAAIQALVDVPLVLHGASGVPDEMLIRAVSMPGGGISKVNIATDLEQDMLKAMGVTSLINEDVLNTYDEEMISIGRNAVKQIVMEKIKKYLLCENKAILYK